MTIISLERKDITPIKEGNDTTKKKQRIRKNPENMIAEIFNDRKKKWEDKTQYTSQEGKPKEKRSRLRGTIPGV